MLLVILYDLILVGVGEGVILLLTSLLPLLFSLSLTAFVCVCVCVCVWRGSLSLCLSFPVCTLIQMTKHVFSKLSKHTYNRVLKVGFLFVKATLYWVSNDGIFSSPKLESTQPKCSIDTLLLWFIWCSLFGKVLDIKFLIRPCHELWVGKPILYRCAHTWALVA